MIVRPAGCAKGTQYSWCCNVGLCMSQCNASNCRNMSPMLVNCQKLCEAQLTEKAVAHTHLVVDVLANVGQEAHEVPLLAIELVLDLGVLVLLVLSKLSLDRRVLVLALAEDVLLDLSILVELALQECCSHAQLQATCALFMLPSVSVDR